MEVVIGEAADSVKKLSSVGRLEKIDVLVLDHWEDCYIADLKVCEDLKLLKKGSIVFADNVLFPGAPEYLEYIENTTGLVKYESKGFDSMMPNGWKARQALRPKDTCADL